jgi:hypothetical protein
MSCAIVEQRRDGTRRVVRLVGVFDGATERWIREFLDGLAPGSAATLDFSAVRDLAPVSLGRLVEALARTSGAVRLEGLDTRQQRLLRYLGCDAASL